MQLPPGGCALSGARNLNVRNRSSGWFADECPGEHGVYWRHEGPHTARSRLAICEPTTEVRRYLGSWFAHAGYRVNTGIPEVNP
jgi:hypothetical protein